MEQFMDGVITGLWFLGVILTLAAVPASIYWLAKNDLFFTIVEEGTAKAIMLNGSFHHMIMAYSGYRFRGGDGENQWEVVETEEWEEDSTGIFGGLYWVGIPPFFRVYEYKFTWTSLEQKGGARGTEESFETHKDEPIRHIFLKDDVYVFTLKNVELSGGLPVDVILLFTARVVNPFKALFRVERWLEATQNRTGAEFRPELGKISYEELTAHQDGGEGRVAQLLRDLAILHDPLIKNRFGIEAVGGERRALQIHSFDPPEEFRELTLKKFTAEQEREATLVKADAEKTQQELVAEGRANAIKKVNDAVLERGDDGLTLRTLEAIENAGANVTLVAKDANFLPTFDVGRAQQRTNREET